MDFRLVPSPANYPSKTICHRTAGDTEPVVDTNVDLYGKHRIYLSRSEVNQAARLYGYVSPERHGEIVEGYEDELAKLRLKVQALEENVSVPLAEVIDYFEAKARLRPEETPSGEVVA